MGLRDQVFIYHLTAISNLESILENGLVSRKRIQKKKFNYCNVANQEIIEKRMSSGLENYVPFHWRSKTPFAGDVMKHHKDTDFCYILIRRTVAEANGFKVVPTHPLHGLSEVLDYVTGFNTINWELMDTRDYSNEECKETSMAECLSPKVVSPKLFASICVKNMDSKNKVYNIILRSSLSLDEKERLKNSIWVNPDFFVK